MKSRIVSLTIKKKMKSTLVNNQRARNAETTSHQGRCNVISHIQRRWGRSITFRLSMRQVNEPGHNISYKIACGPCEDSDQLVLKTIWILGYAHNKLLRLLSDCADAHAELSLRWTHIIQLLTIEVLDMT